MGQPSPWTTLLCFIQRRRRRRRPAADAPERNGPSVRQQSVRDVVGADVRSSGRLPRRRVPHRGAVGAAYRSARPRRQRLQLDDAVAWRHLPVPRRRLLRPPDVRLGVTGVRRRTVAAAVAAQPPKRCCYRTYWR